MNPTFIGQIFAGDAWAQEIIVNQAGQDFTGCSLSTELFRTSAQPSPTPVSPSPAVVFTVTAPTQITATLSLLDTDTATLGAGTYLGRLRLTTAAGFGPVTYFEFTMQIVP